MPLFTPGLFHSEYFSADPLTVKVAFIGWISVIPISQWEKLLLKKNQKPAVGGFLCTSMRTGHYRNQCDLLSAVWISVNETVNETAPV